jgi:hypothetical protein
VLSVSDHNNNHDIIFHCAVSRRMQLLSYFAVSSSSHSVAVGTRRTSRLRDEDALEISIKLYFEQAKTAQEGCRNLSLIFFNPDATSWRWSTPRPGKFALGKETRLPFTRRVHGPQFRLDMCENSRLPPSPRYSIPGPLPAHVKAH